MATRTLDASRTITAGAVTVTTRAQPLLVELDPMVLAAGAAAALAAAIATGIREITATIAPATAIYRAKARKAFERGAAWALERYSSAPDEGDALFNDSGELANSVQVDAGDGAFEISLPAGRLSPAGGSDLSDKLAELVPALDAPFDDDGVAAAIEDSLDAMVKVGSL